MKVMRWALLLLLVLLLSLLPFGISSAAAQEPTGTPTWEPLFKTATPAPTRSYDCPNTLPAGWGTVTPQAWWSMNCSQCLLQLTPSLTPEPTFTPWASETPGGPTPTATATETPEFVLHVYQDFAPFEFTTFNSSSGQVFYYPSAGPGQDYVHWVSNGDIVIVGFIVDYVTGAGGGGWTFGDIAGQVGWGGAFNRTFAGMISTWDGANSLLAGHGWDSTSYNAERDALLSVYPLSQGNTGFAVVHSGSQDSTGWAEGIRVRWQRGTQAGPQTWRIRGIVYAITGSLEPPGPQPVVDYCGTVNDGLVSGPETDLGVSLPTVEVGASSCYGFDGLFVEIGDWEINMPALQLCLKPIRFGSLDLFGIVISIDLMLSALGGVLVLRWALRS